MHSDRARASKCAAVICVFLIATLCSCGAEDPAGGATGVATSTVSEPPATTQTTVQDPTSMPAFDAPPGEPLPADDAQAVRAAAAAYWDAYNAYDADRAVSYLDEAYRPTIEETIRSEIARIETFGVTLGVTEKTPPALIGPDEAEIYLTMQEPIGTRTILMRFAKQGDDWVITYSQEVE